MKSFLKLLCLLFVVSCSTHNDDNNTPSPSTNPDTKHSYTVIQGKNGLQYHTGLLPQDPEMKGLGGSHVRLTDCGSMPESFDLRSLGLVPDIRDQGQCGSCWAFSKTGSLESALLGQGIKLDLAMQELVSCDKQQYGCEGGMLSDFKYQISHGQGLASDFPYTSGRSGSNGSCKNVSAAGKGISFQYIGSADKGPTDSELKCALYTYKTVPWITVGATNGWSSPPKSEKTAYTSCGRSQTNHAVGVVGWWTDKQGKTQWIMKNSWSSSWGDKGYMSLPLGCNSFGEEVAFIEVAKNPDPSPTPPGPSPTPPGPTPTPGPCVAPKAKLPAEVQYLQGTEVMLGVKPEAGVQYTWTIQGESAVLGTESMLYVSPVKDSVYKLSAKNTCAISESLVRVRLVMSLQAR